MAGRRRPAGENVRALGECGHEWFVTYRQARQTEAAQVRVYCKGGCRRQVRVTFDFEGRVCSGLNCSNVLTRYNPGPTCFACDEAKGKAAADRVKQKAAA